MLVATIFRMTPWGAFRPFGISSLGKSSFSTFMVPGLSNTTARLLSAMLSLLTWGIPARCDSGPGCGGVATGGPFERMRTWRYVSVTLRVN